MNMNNKEYMIEMIMDKYGQILTEEELQKFKSSLEKQDEISVWETYVKNCGN